MSWFHRSAGLHSSRESSWPRQDRPCKWQRARILHDMRETFVSSATGSNANHQPTPGLLISTVHTSSSSVVQIHFHFPIYLHFMEPMNQNLNFNSIPISQCEILGMKWERGYIPIFLSNLQSSLAERLKICFTRSIRLMAIQDV